MATLTLVRQDTHMLIRSQGFSLQIKDPWSNRKVVFIVLRALISVETGKPLFTYQQLADVFGYRHRQNIRNFWQEWEQSGCDLRIYLQRRHKVDEGVVQAVREMLRRRPSATAVQRCPEVADRLDRPELTPANIRTAFEEVSCQVIRPVLQRQWEAGRFHPKEEVVLQETLAALLSSRPSSRPPVVDDLQALGMNSAEPVEAETVQQQQHAACAVLLTPHAPVEQVPAKIRLMVVALTLYFWNVPLSRIAIWYGVSKTTVYHWVIGLAVTLFAVIQAWIVQHVKAARVALDEKWLKIRTHWHYWFVTLDEATGLPVCTALLPTRTAWTCCWVLVTLKRLGKLPQAVITDGRAGYAACLPVVLPTLKRKMKRVVQTPDPRTVQRRLTRLATEDVPDVDGRDPWISRIRGRLSQLVPALRRNSYPRTTNAIERFFRAFQRFYKTRGGFHSIISAKRELMLFVVVYVFTIQAGTGRAPIEKIVPQAKHMPLYKLLNDPFRYGLANMCQGKRGETGHMATHGSALVLKSY